MAIRPKEGRYYKDACGNVGGPAERVKNDWYPWFIKFSGILRTYTDDGARFVGNEGHYTDLVSECDKDGNPIEDEAMTGAPKPETVTITQEMVDIAILDAVKTGDVARANQINQTWVGMQRALTNAS